jgi:hypothetical protein
MRAGTVLDSDVVIVGTGLAALIAASRLHAEGRQVVILNPDPDFFAEDSELPFDPLLEVEGVKGARWRSSLGESVVEALRPDFPGPLEYWVGEQESRSLRDPDAPTVRARSRLWLDPPGLETLFLEASDAGLKPQLVDGVSAFGKLPGFVAERCRPEEWEDCRAVLIPRLGDLDVGRYRAGVLEFVRERLGASRMLHGVSSLASTPDGLRFHTPTEGARSLRVRDGVVAFWTPKLSAWIQGQMRDAGVRLETPPRLQRWESWSLVSKDPLPANVMGVLGNELVFWALGDGVPGGRRVPGGATVGVNRLAVLRRAREVASEESFHALSRLCYDRLRWDRFSIRSLRVRSLLEWDFRGEARPWVEFDRAGVRMVFAAHSDGPVWQVVETARRMVTLLGADPAGARASGGVS